VSSPFDSRLLPMSLHMDTARGYWIYSIWHLRVAFGRRTGTLSLPLLGEGIVLRCNPRAY
jgi:hypothetical protein